MRDSDDKGRASSLELRTRDVQALIFRELVFPFAAHTCRLTGCWSQIDRVRVVSYEKSEKQAAARNNSCSDLRPALISTNGMPSLTTTKCGGKLSPSPALTAGRFRQVARGRHSREWPHVAATELTRRARQLRSGAVLAGLLETTFSVILRDPIQSRTWGLVV